MEKSKYFTTLDLRSAYWQVPLDPETANKTGFVTGRGSWKFKVLLYGLTNSPAVFQRLMDLVLTELTWEAYIDNIFVESLEQHFRCLKAVLDRLRQAGLKLKMSKCHLFQIHMAFHGFVLSARGGRAKPRKCAGCGGQAKANNTHPDEMVCCLSIII